MEVQALKQLIRNNTVPNFLIFTGEEWKVQDIYIEHIAKVNHLQTCYVEDVCTNMSLMSGKSLFNQNYLYIIQDDKNFVSNDKLQNKVITNLKDNILILKLTSVDKRLKLLKTYKDNIVEFNVLTDAILTQYIQREIPLSDRNCQKLIDVCEHNYGRILLEIDKIRRYISGDRTDNTTMDYDTSFMQLLEQGAIYIPPKDAIFDFVKAILQNRPKLAFQLYEECKAVGEATMVILSVLYNNTKQVLQVQTCNSSDIGKTTGLTGWQIRNAKECINRFGAGDLVYLMRLIQRVEVGIKSGKIEEQVAVDYVLTSFL